MDILSDLRSRLPFRSTRPGDGGDRLDSVGAELMASEYFLVAEIDRAGLITEANPGLCRGRGVELDELLGAGLLYLVNAEERAAFSDLVRSAFGGDRGGEVVARLLTANGDSMPAIRWGFLPLRDATGTVGSVLCLGTDLSRHLDAAPPGRATRELQEELEALREGHKTIGKESRRLRKELKLAESRISATPPPPVPAELVTQDEGPVPLTEIERRHIFHTLQGCKGRVSGPKGAAAVLGLHPNTLRSRMEKLGIGKNG